MDLDIRSKFVVLLVSSISIFLINNLIYEMFIVVLIAVLQLLSKRQALSLKLTAVYFVLVIIQIFILPWLPSGIRMLISVPAVQLRKMFPSIMTLLLIIRTTKVSRFIATLTKMKIPRSVTITLAITFRFFPAIIEEWGHIRNAMRIRRVWADTKNPFSLIWMRIECYLVPMLFSAAKTADELTAASVTRGIDNPAERACRDYKKLDISDYIIIILFSMILGASVFYKVKTG